MITERRKEVKVVAFDIEIAKPIPPETGGDWHSARPLGISCASTVESDGDHIRWHSAKHAGDRFAVQMADFEVRRFVDYLAKCVERGYTIVTWNGLSFDWQIVAEECNNQHYAAKCAQMAMEHIDPAFHMLCAKGYMIGLSAAAKGMNVGDKTEGMHGSLAPLLWTGNMETATTKDGEQIAELGVIPGTPEAQELCLKYVLQDSRVTMDVFQAIEKAGHIAWTARSGRPNKWYFTEPLTAKLALLIHPPDTSWMDKPRSREACYEWTKEALGGRN